MRTLLALLAVASVTVSALAQGTVNFNNNVWESTIPRRVTDMNGAPLVGTDWVAQLYYGSTPYDLRAVANAPARFRVATTTQPGTWEGGTRALTGFGPGDTVWLQVLVWNRAAFLNWDAIAPAGGIAGWASCPFTYTVPSSPWLPPQAWWLSGFSATNNWGEFRVFAFRRSGNSLELCSCRAQLWDLRCMAWVSQRSSITDPGVFLRTAGAGDTFLIPMTNDMGFFELGWCWCPP
jgi:hypothetical protein